MPVYQYSDGQNIDELVHNMIERTSGLLTRSGLESYLAIGFDIQEAELSILFQESTDIDHMLKITELPARSSVSIRARELYETWGLPRKNVINFQDNEIDQLFSALEYFTEGCAYS
ncbi:MAG: hypothetical protein HOI47_14330 [Candidatus Scalindua sp.]|nr:hypothetical protein [Candidatus Scalindua sp.]